MTRLSFGYDGHQGYHTNPISRAKSEKADNLLSPAIRTVQIKYDCNSYITANAMVKVPQEIPNEIIREIFSYASLPLQVNRAGEFPWHLGHICTAWRGVFLSMHTHFWSEIKIKWPELFSHSSASKYTERIIEILNFFLQCGQQSPFSFELSNTVYEEAQFDKVLSVLAQESKRWQGASLRVCPSQVPTLYRVKDSLPRLEYLHLDLWSPYSKWNSSALIEPYLDLFENAPLLTQVNSRSSTIWRFNWSTLVALEMMAKNIDIRQTGLIKLPRLKRLSAFSDLLTVLDAPALYRLEITFDGSPSETPSALALNAVIAFLCRSSCKLGYLTVEKCTAAGVKEILEHVPTVRNLHLLHVSDTMDMIGWLSGKRPGRNAYPPLNFLVRMRIFTNLFSWQEVNEIIGMLRYRAESNVEHLRKLSILSHMAKSSRGIFDTAVEQLISECHAQGIQIDFRFVELDDSLVVLP